MRCPQRTAIRAPERFEILAIAAVPDEFPAEVALANPGLNRVFRALAPMARLLGHRPLYSRNWVANQLTSDNA